MKKRIISLVLCFVMLASMASLFSGCGSTTNDTFVIMSEELDGLFNPFYSTTGPDNTIVGMTQIGMLTSKYVNGNVEVAFGDDQPTVSKDFAFEYNKDLNETVYTFVLKKNIKFSDGKPLTMEDVLFNLYVYLDPVYTGSSTLCSTDIKGLNAYRTQTISSSNTNSDEKITQAANARANARLNELIALYMEAGRTGTPGSYNATYEALKTAIASKTLSDDYKSAISVEKGEEVTSAHLLADLDKALKYFREEYEAHIRDKRCPAGVCKALAPITIDPEKCRGCTACMKMGCPAIHMENGKAAIDNTLCVGCGVCKQLCAFGAITD
jgi:ABC-type transport system substrate-binding protein/Pyruvate/2-oxoacid:ferredoxin oxidoreductase delta subunit